MNLLKALLLSLCLPFGEAKASLQHSHEEYLEIALRLNEKAAKLNHNLETFPASYILAFSVCIYASSATLEENPPSGGRDEGQVIRESITFAPKMGVIFPAVLLIANAMLGDTPEDTPFTFVLGESEHKPLFSSPLPPDTILTEVDVDTQKMKEKLEPEMAELQNLGVDEYLDSILRK